MAARYNRGSLYVFIQYKHSKDVIDAGLVDKELLDFFDENELAVLTTKKLCHRMDPAKRSTAMEVEQYLREKLKEFNIKRYYV